MKCEICGKETKTKRCIVCGKSVCANHFYLMMSVCADCISDEVKGKYGR